MFSQYHVLERIGEGSFGKVRHDDGCCGSSYGVCFAGRQPQQQHILV